jgi:hypothetical protein
VLKAVLRKRPLQQAAGCCPFLEALMLQKFQQLPLRWRILLGTQLFVTAGIMVHRVHLLEQQKVKRAELERLRNAAAEN